ncbi:MAG: hypothetical protein AAB215_09485 [Planctomycetota bacterium]
MTVDGTETTTSPGKPKRLIVWSGLACILAALVVIPSLMRSRLTANESATIGLLKKIVMAQEQYRSTVADGKRYADSLQELAALGLLAPLPERNRASGYYVLISADPPLPDGSIANWDGIAVPLVPGKTGNLCFYVDSSGVIRFSSNANLGNSR